MSSQIFEETIAMKSVPYKEFLTGKITYINVAWDTTRKLYYVHSRRERPEVLVLNPTSIGLMYKEKRHVAIHKRYSSYHRAYLNSWRSASVPEGDLAYPTTDWDLRLRRDIKSLRINLGASVAEYRETGKMFHDAVIGIRRYKKYLQKKLAGRKTYRKKLNLHDVSASQLGINFGLAPLIGDLSDIAIRLQQRMDGPPVIMRFVVTAKESTESSDNEAYTFQKWTRSDRAIFYVSYDFNNDGITLGNAAEVAWELVPFSFIVDSIIPIGEWLSSLDALKYTGDIIGTVTTKSKFNGVVRTPDTYDQVEQGTTTREEYFRNVYTSIPIPSFPSYAPSGTLSTILNDLALLHQLRK